MQLGPAVSLSNVFLIVHKLIFSFILPLVIRWDLQALELPQNPSVPDKIAKHSRHVGQVLVETHFEGRV